MKTILLCIILICNTESLWAEIESGGDKKCQANGFENCTSNKECCSDYCDKNIGEGIGICTEASREIVSESPPLITSNRYKRQTGYSYHQEEQHHFSSHNGGSNWPPSVQGHQVSTFSHSNYPQGVQRQQKFSTYSQNNWPQGPERRQEFYSENNWPPGGSQNQPLTTHTQVYWSNGVPQKPPQSNFPLNDLQSQPSTHTQIYWSNSEPQVSQFVRQPHNRWPQQGRSPERQSHWQKVPELSLTGNTGLNPITHILREVTQLGQLLPAGKRKPVKENQPERLIDEEKFIDDDDPDEEEFTITLERPCNPVKSEKLDLICSTPDGKEARCDKPLINKSTVIFSCNPKTHRKIKDQEYHSIKCIDGKWDRPLKDDFCLPAFADCGKPLFDSSIQAVVANGKTVKYGQFPWHAAIYEYNEDYDSYNLLCGGTLISPKVVVSAAHCFAIMKHRDVKSKDPSTIKVELGKYHRAFNSSKDHAAIIVDVREIKLSPHYYDSKGQYTYDIAFLILKKDVIYTKAVRPVCIDLDPEDNLNGKKGKVVGWGLTAEKEPSETLMMAELPFVSKKECRSKIQETMINYVSFDKMCAGDKFSNVTVCQGDSGGGLVFKNPENKAYYLRGIVSLGPKGCKGKEFSLFTDLLTHKDLVRKYLQLK